MHGNIDLLAKLVSDKSLGDRFTQWARDESSIRVLIILGSRARLSGQPGAADAGSDWDYQVVSNRPAEFEGVSWTASAGLSKPLAYAIRPGRLGRVTKVSCVFPEGEMDVAFLPLSQFRLARLLLRLGLVTRIPRARYALAELAMVLAPGYHILKGASGWQNFFYDVVATIQPLRVDDEAIITMAEAFVCDYLSTRRKIARGEFLAAQRWLHTQLAETNYRLLHELKLRLSEPSFPDARRLEQLGRDEWLDAVSVSTTPSSAQLLDAVGKSAQTFRRLVEKLVGPRWEWPKGL